MKNHENYVEAEITEVNGTNESEGFMTKLGRGIKKHGPKIAVGAAALVCGLIGFALGKKSNEDVYEIEFDDSFDDTDYSVETAEEEN